MNLGRSSAPSTASGSPSGNGATKTGRGTSPRRSTSTTKITSPRREMSGSSGSLPRSNSLRMPPRTRSAEDQAKVQAYKSHRGSTQVTPNTSVMEYAMPKKKVLQSETDRWLKLGSKVKPFVAGLEQYLGSLFSPAIACECSSLTYSETYETVALTIPKEVLNIAKQRQKNGERLPFKLEGQAKMSAFEILERLRLIFSWIALEKDNMQNHVTQKGSVDISHVIQLQFFYKYFLRLLNHWNYAHLDESGGIPTGLQRNFLLTINDKVVGGFLGIVVNEMDFLRVHLRIADVAGMGKDRDADDTESSSGGADSSLLSSFPQVIKARSLSGWATGPTRRLTRSTPGTPAEAKSKSPSPDTSPGSRSPVGASPRKSITSPKPRRQSEQIPIPSSQTQRTNYSLEDKLGVLPNVYKDERYKNRFLRFAATKYAEENVLFLVDIYKIKQADQGARKELMKNLHSEFLDASSEKEVNLSSKAKKGIMKGYEEDYDYEDMMIFELAVKEVEHQVVQNLVTDFLQEGGGEDEGEEDIEVVMVKDGRVKSPGRRSSILERFQSQGRLNASGSISHDDHEGHGSIPLELSDSDDIIVPGNDAASPPEREGPVSESVIPDNDQRTPAEKQKLTNDGTGFMRPRQFSKPLPLLPPELPSVGQGGEGSGIGSRPVPSSPPPPPPDASLLPPPVGRPTSGISPHEYEHL